MDVFDNIKLSSLTIYDNISSDDRLYIPSELLEQRLNDKLVGLSLDGYAIRTRSKIVKQQICLALGYPIPKSFKKTQPRFPGQNFDVYNQQSNNIQIWNEEIDYKRRYVIVKISESYIVQKIKVITGDTLAKYDKTGTLTSKYQATMKSYGMSKLFSMHDTDNIKAFLNLDNTSKIISLPNDLPVKGQMLPISVIYERLQPLVGICIGRIDAVQERNRGAALHQLICKLLGYSRYADDGSYPDIRNQMIEIKLQTSPTIDLGRHNPTEQSPIPSLSNLNFCGLDVRYIIVDSSISNTNPDLVMLNHLYVVTGKDFCTYFPLFKGKVQNKKIQLPLPYNFFN